MKLYEQSSDCSLVTPYIITATKWLNDYNPCLSFPPFSPSRSKLPLLQARHCQPLRISHLQTPIVVMFHYTYVVHSRHLRGFVSFWVVNLRCSMAWGWIKHLVAPQSSSAFWLTCFVLVHSWKGTWIAWFQAIYIEPELFRTAWVRAIVLRCQENPYLLPWSTFYPWTLHDLPWLGMQLMQWETQLGQKRSCHWRWLIDCLLFGQYEHMLVCWDSCTQGDLVFHSGSIDQSCDTSLSLFQLWPCGLQKCPWCYRFREEDVVMGAGCHFLDHASSDYWSWRFLLC